MIYFSRLELRGVRFSLFGDKTQVCVLYAEKREKRAYFGYNFI